MYWESAPDTHNIAFSSAMSRNRFDEIMKFLYFYDKNDNSYASCGDKCAKVRLRPIISKLNELFKKYSPNDMKGDVDEAMIPYFGN